jgi:hypothetical protein
MDCVYENMIEFLLFENRWCSKNSKELKEINSNLEFNLHRLNFIKLVQQGVSKQHEALKYSRNFTPFAAKCSKGK